MKKISLTIISLTLTLLGTSVTPSFANSSTYLGCQKNDINCFENYISPLVKSSSISKVLATYKDIATNTNGIEGQCNNFGRFIGRELFKAKGENVFNYHDSTCGEPFAYGFMLAYGTLHKDKLDVSKFVKYCLTDSNPGGCAYGVGNGQAMTNNTPIMVNNNCVKAFSNFDKAKTGVPYETSAEGICLLGWVSGRSDILPPTYFRSISSAENLCQGLIGGSQIACLGEATFSYTYAGNPSSEQRLARIFELSKRCTTDKSTTCVRFVGKALDDYKLYSLRPNLGNPKEAANFANLIIKLCNGPLEKYCLTGMLAADMVHTSRNDALNLCQILTGNWRKECLSAFN